MLNHKSILHSYCSSLNADDLHAIARAKERCDHAVAQLGADAQVEAHIQFTESIISSLSCKSDYYMNELDKHVTCSFGDPLPPVRNEREFLVYVGLDGEDREIKVIEGVDNVEQAVQRSIKELTVDIETDTTVYVDLAVEIYPDSSIYQSDIHNIIGPKYAVIINCIGGSKSISYDEQEDGTITPTLFDKQWEALKEIDDCMNEGVGVEDWDVEKVTVCGDTITIVDTGETFNWKDSIS